ncbi:multidrug ABC transporter permease [Streptomyces sulfonofaciens]|uniref:Multidrug ABC transporter permease n=1 Tax=Streptomyces sulfonofaciens TaxID=68272 RepID=A0A919GH88_9ACTN|nr:ABC transporter ATP-binding protein [Streptomyces sulfonofaciens]GHH83925.1 multidrug ABC transporter permease [Streptomyces sulfonofaciens]
MKSAHTRLRLWWTESFLGRLRVLRCIPYAGARIVTALLVINLSLSLTPIAFMLTMSAVVGRLPVAVHDGLGSPAWSGVLTMMSVAVFVYVVQGVLSELQTAVGDQMTRRVDGRLQQDLIASSLSGTGIAPLEDAKALDALEELNRWYEGRLYTPGSGSAGMLALLARYPRLLFFVGAVGMAVGWLPAVVLLVAVMAFRTGQRGGLRLFARAFDGWVSGQLRRRDHLRDVVIGATHAKELRIFGLTGWFTDRYAAAHLAATEVINQARRRALFRPYLGYCALGLVAVGFVFVTIGRGLAGGQVTLTSGVLATQATLAAVLLGGQYPEADMPTSMGMRALEVTEAFHDRVAEVERANPPAASPEPAVSAAGRPLESIRLESVGFGYPGSARPQLDGLDLELPAGSCTAIVGVNGAGKSTLVKLLTRLYEPDSGRITLDGTDLRAVPLADWRRQVSVVFQDFVRYEFSAADNIAFGAPHIAPDPAAIRSAAERAGILPALERLPKGLDTILSRAYAGGADLSGGQWQRIAIARALYAIDAGARLLILDEPTSALDARAEGRFFDSFVSLTQGVTSVLISHRLSSVRRADQIVVLDGGRVAERGTHEALMAADGTYAALYRLQAERFDTGPDAVRFPVGGAS